MRKLLLASVAVAALAASLISAQAQQAVRTCVYAANAQGGFNCVDVIPGQFVPGTAIGGNATGTTGAVVGTLAAAAGKTTFICDFDVSAIGGTAAVGPIVIAGLLGGSRTYQMSSSAAGVTLSKTFSPCMPASAVNTAITITTTADGSASAVDVNSSGYQQ